MPNPVHFQTVSVNDQHSGTALKLFYREAGSPDAPAILLLHGFPSSSHQYRGLIDRLSDKYRVIAPDLPGFGFPMPRRRRIQLHLRSSCRDH